MKKIAFITLLLVGTMGVATAQETSETIEVPAKTSNLKRGFRMLIQGSVDYLFESYSAKTMITFGYQISPYLYFGSGFGFNFLSGPKIYVPEIPVFARCRATLLDRANTPFVDHKVAATIFDRLYLIGGIPFSVTSSTSVGYRLGIGKKAGLSLSVGFRLQYYLLANSIFNGLSHFPFGGPVATIGFDF